MSMLEGRKKMPNTNYVTVIGKSGSVLKTNFLFFYICILQVHKYMLKYINDIISFGILSTSNYTEK